MASYQFSYSLIQSTAELGKENAEINAWIRKQTKQRKLIDRGMNDYECMKENEQN